MSSSMLDERFAKLENAGREIHMIKGPNLQRLPSNVRDRAQFARFYTPRMISIGPIHHHLQLGQQCKLLWTKMYLQDRNLTARQVYSRLLNGISIWKELFTNDAIGDYNDEDLAWMLLIDGCSVLYIITSVETDVDPPTKINLQSDLLTKLNLKGDQLLLVKMDLLLLENQLPYELLFVLWWNRTRESLTRALITFFMSNRHQFEVAKRQESSIIMKNLGYGGYNPQHSHLLVPLREVLLLPDGLSSNDDISVAIQKGHWENVQECPVYRNVHELKAVGIRVTRNMQARCQTDIKFVTNIIDAELQIPRLNVTEEMAQIFLNLIALEVCPDFQNDYGIISYLNFLSSLIDNADDVKELREAGVLLNAIGSDLELLSLFRTICADLMPMCSLSMPKYRCIRSQMEVFCRGSRGRNKCRTWIVEAYNTYFRSPWTILAFLGALLGLFLTAVQTWYAVYRK